jgi:hypothetical protein
LPTLLIVILLVDRDRIDPYTKRLFVGRRSEMLQRGLEIFGNY